VTPDLNDYGTDELLQALARMREMWNQFNDEGNLAIEARIFAAGVAIIHSMEQAVTVTREPD
jgi:hypothetical protein